MGETSKETGVKVKRSDKDEFVQNLKKEFDNSSSVIVTHYAGLSVKEIDDLRKAMRDNGAKFKVTKNRLTKLALADTQYESIIDLFNGPTAIAYSKDSVAPSRVAVDFEKKFQNFKIIGGSFEGEKIDKNKINFFSYTSITRWNKRKINRINICFSSKNYISSSGTWRSIGKIDDFTK